MINDILYIVYLTNKVIYILLKINITKIQQKKYKITKDKCPGKEKRVLWLSFSLYKC
jgi:hypothetical protein